MIALPRAVLWSDAVFTNSRERNFKTRILHPEFQILSGQIIATETGRAAFKPRIGKRDGVLVPTGCHWSKINKDLGKINVLGINSLGAVGGGPAVHIDGTLDHLTWLFGCRRGLRGVFDRRWCRSIAGDDHLLRRLGYGRLLLAVLTATRKRTTCGSSRECEWGGAQEGSKHVVPFEARSVRVYAVLTLAKSTRGSPVGDPRGKNQVSNNMRWHAPHVVPVSVSDTEHVAAKDAVDRQNTSAARALASGEHVVSSRRVVRVCATRSYKPQTSSCGCCARGSR